MITRLTLVAALMLTAVSLRCETEDPDDWDWEASTAQVNEGRLRFLERPTDAPVHHHDNRIRISRSSLIDGWVSIDQCHEHLDPVAATQILFNPQRVRAIQIVRSSGIGHLETRDSSVQLRNIVIDATLCLKLESRALQPLPDGRFRLENGPYMRRFLDGYYPMRVSLEIYYPPDLLVPDRHEPKRQPGFQLDSQPGHIEAHARFEGELYTRFTFRRTGLPDQVYPPD